MSDITSSIFSDFSQLTRTGYGSLNRFATDFSFRILRFTYQRAHLIIAPVFDHGAARCFDPNTYSHEEIFFFSLL